MPECDHPAKLTSHLTLLALSLLAAWLAFQLPRLTQPVRGGHEAWISRQIGRTALNHLRLGFRVTKGANVTVVKNDGTLLVHMSYSPLASWLLTVPLAAGLSLDGATRLVSLVMLFLFLLGLWRFSTLNWGPAFGVLVLLYASSFPVTLFKYVPTYIFEILALTPIVWTLVLLSRDHRSWPAIALLSITSVLFSWISWVIVVPCILVELYRERTRGILITLALVALVPPAIHVAISVAAGGDLGGFLRHLIERLSGTQVGEMDPSATISMKQTVVQLRERWLAYLGAFSLASTMVAGAAAIASLSLRLRRPSGNNEVGPTSSVSTRQASWIGLLALLGLPLNLLFRNIAHYHDFFIILFVPLVAISCAWVTLSFVTMIPATRRAQGVLVLVAAYVGIDVLPHRHMARATPEDYELRAQFEVIGEAIRATDFVIADRSLFFENNPYEKLPLSDREQPLLPAYGGLVSQSAFLVYDVDELASVGALARKGQRKVLLVRGPKQSWPLPIGYRPLTSSTQKLLIAANEE